MPITKIKPTNISNTGVYGISTGTDITQNNSITAAFNAAIAVAVAFAVVIATAL